MKSFDKREKGEVLNVILWATCQRICDIWEWSRDWACSECRKSKEVALQRKTESILMSAKSYRWVHDAFVRPLTCSKLQNDEHRQKGKREKGEVLHVILWATCQRICVIWEWSDWSCSECRRSKQADVQRETASVLKTAILKAFFKKGYLKHLGFHLSGIPDRENSWKTNCR